MIDAPSWPVPPVHPSGSRMKLLVFAVRSAIAQRQHEAALEREREATRVRLCRLIAGAR